MRVRHKPWAKDFLAEHPEVVIAGPEKGVSRNTFGKDQKIHIEIGSGKGQFIMSLAQANPDINFIGIEMQESIIVSIVEKWLDNPLPNLKLLQFDAAGLLEVFKPGEISQIYLNFSDPWPKNRHEKRRLTSAGFLGLYEQLLTSDGEIHFKTDNRKFFEYSLESFSRYGCLLKNLSLDLHALPGQAAPAAYITTEYEEKFMAKGQPIYRCEIEFK